MGAKTKQGFAAMDPDARKKIASKGGKAAHAKGRAHEFSSEEARAAGWKGGMVVSGDRGYMAELGRKGGFARARNRRARAEADSKGRDSKTGSGDQPDDEKTREPAGDG
jgi:hypothetical protein